MQKVYAEAAKGPLVNFFKNELKNGFCYKVLVKANQHSLLVKVTGDRDPDSALPLVLGSQRVFGL